MEKSIQELALSNSFILSAEAHYANGSLLLVYEKNRRADVIRFIDNLNFRSLQPLPEEDPIRKIDENFKQKLVRVGVNQLVRKLLIPAPLRPFFVMYRAAKYIFKGLDALAQVLPEEKHSHIEQLKADGHCVIMVGDGINDAPALAAADVSVAMSDASDIAKETADITLRGTGLDELAVMRKISEQLMRRIHANYHFIVGFNSALLLLGFGGIISPSLSALLHNGSTMAICMRSMLPLLGDQQ